MECMVKKLKIEQHIVTRKLWEEVFEEDTKEFLDYYYENIATENTIYTIEDKSMLHLNPYSVNIGETQHIVNYIVAVATKKEFRKQGLMKKILLCAINDMYNNKEPFTFLMPAAESIYTPYGFVNISTQKSYILCKEKDLYSQLKNGYKFEYLNVKNIPDLLLFSNKILEKTYKIYTERNIAYYEKLIKEQEVQNGGILLLKKENNILGYVILASENDINLRELVLPEGMVIEGGTAKEQNMMGRILHLDTFMNALVGLPEIKDQYKKFRVYDPIIDKNNGIYQLCTKQNKLEGLEYYYKKVKQESREYSKQYADNEITQENYGKIKDTKIRTYEINQLTKKIFNDIPTLLNEIV